MEEGDKIIKDLDQGQLCFINEWARVRTDTHFEYLVQAESNYQQPQT